jgi:MFS family permease
LIALMLWVAALNTALAIPFGAWWYGSILAVTMLGVPAAVVLLDVLIFRQVDDGVRGRTISATMTLLNVGVSLGPLAAGLLLQYAGATTAVFAFSALSAAAGLGALSSRAVRSAHWPKPVPVPPLAPVSASAPTPAPTPAQAASPPMHPGPASLPTSSLAPEAVTTGV